VVIFSQKRQLGIGASKGAQKWRNNKTSTYTESRSEQGQFVTSVKKSRCLQWDNGLTNEHCTLTAHEMQRHFTCCCTRHLSQQQTNHNIADFTQAQAACCNSHIILTGVRLWCFEQWLG